jgi:hypothetical protein
MPNSPILWFAAGMLWIMDASINVSMRFVFVGDSLPENNAQWDLPCKVSLLSWRLLLLQNYR